MTDRELEIIKASLEGDIIRQKNHENKDHPAFKSWLEDTEALLKKVNAKLYRNRAIDQYLKGRNK